jgi:hypothetical protein
VELLDEQRRYLICFREVVRRLAGGASRLDDAGRAELDAVMRRFLPDAPLSWLVGLGGDAVAAELATVSGV